MKRIIVLLMTMNLYVLTGCRFGNETESVDSNYDSTKKSRVDYDSTYIDNTRVKNDTVHTY